jgi:rfaE bifunctional protein nucleotidyltransferase chain/domain
VAGDRPVVWDPHPNGQPPIAGATLVTPNEREARLFAGLDAPADPADRLAQAATAATALLQGWEVGAVSVTLGSLGALLSTGPGSPLMVPARPSGPGDACGAGDCYAVTASAALAGGAVLSEAVIAAVAAASAFVAAGGGPPDRPLDGPAAPYQAVPYGSEPSSPAAPASAAGALELAARRRAAGERVVVAGGCFDLLHRGHVELLSAARRLGDCLIVAINSDRSVRQLKGPDRPVMPEAERATILRALAAVDDVLVFDAASPVDALRRLRPHVFVKGGDYAGLAIEEQPVLAEWGGQVVTVPYLPEYSTTRIVEGVRHV